MTPEEMRELVSYDPETGSMIWLPRKSKRWNTNFAGKPAFGNLSNGYLTGRTLGKNYKAHRIAWALFYGEWPSGMIDHINGNRNDNRISNLRVVDAIGNARNMRKRASNTSGYTGVTWFARDKKWWAKIIVNRRCIHIGYFTEILDAVAARAKACKEYGYHENHGK